MNRKPNLFLRGRVQGKPRQGRPQLSTWLTWLVISAQILTLISTATVTAIQPTPQMAQAAAHQAGLGDWFSARAAHVAQIAQHWWGTPATAQAVSAAPGGVTTGLKVWLKADAGITAADGASVATWTDSSANAYNVAQGTVAQQPKFYSTTTGKLVNFNPSVEFDGVDDYIINTTAVMPGTSPYSWILALTDEAPDIGFRQSFTAQDAWDWFGLYKYCGAGCGNNGWVIWSQGGYGAQNNLGKFTKYSPAGGTNGYWNGASYASDSRTQHIQPQIIGLNSVNAATTDPLGTWVDGYKDIPKYGALNYNFTNNSLAYQSHFFKSLAVGTDWSGAVGAEYWKGKIPEVIAYSQNLSDADMQRVNTYLAIKYGMTLGQGNGAVGANGNNVDYMATDGTTKIWDATANTTYKNNLAGIGRDDAESLNQKQSKSVNTGYQVTLGLGAIAATNAANANTFAADKSYEVWGDDGATASFGTAYTPNSFTPVVPSYYRMTRVWKVQETGSVGAVKVMAPGTQADHLLVSNNAAFSGTPTEIALTPDGNGNMVATVDLTNGQFFTLGAPATAPGGVASGLKAWLKADAGISGADGSSVATWADSSLSSYNVAQGTVAQQPKFYSTTTGKLVNFNPSVEFDGVDDYIINTTAVMPGTSPYSWILALTDEAPDIGFRQSFTAQDAWDWFGLYKYCGAGCGNNGWVIWSQGGYGAQNNLGKFTKYSPAGGTNGYWNGASYASDSRTQHIQPQIIGLNSVNAATTDPLGTWVDGYKDIPKYGALNYNFTNNSLAYQSHFFKSLAVGTDWSGAVGAEYWKGKIPEVIAYSQNLSDADMQRVNTYLAIKYGMTLGQGNGAVGANGNNVDYMATDGTTKIWDATANTTYKNNLAGIGRDDAESLNQKQSKSVNTGYQVTLGLGAIAATNAANANTFSANKSYEVWGDDGASTSFGTPYTPNSFVPTTPSYARMTRVWKVQETGSVGAVKVMAPGTQADHLLVSNNAAFSGTPTEIALTPDGNGDMVATVDLTNGQFFTFGAVATAPGGVANGLLTWLKSDAGVAVADGAPIPTWTDQSLNGYDVNALATTAKQPTYQTSSNLVNFNPSINFDGNQYFFNDNPLMPYTSGYTFGWMAQDTYNGGASWRTMYSAESSWDFFSSYKSYYLLGTYNGWIPYGIYGVPDAGYSGKGTFYGPQYNSYWNGTNYTANDPRIQRAQAQLFVEASAGAKTDPYNTWVDGYKDTPNWSHANEIGPHTSFFQRFAIGSDYAGPNGAFEAEDFVGQINEFYVYNRPLTDPEAQKINTYMAIKWGVTLGQGNGAIGHNANNVNYVATDGAVVWNATTNSSYGYNIAGIGRDDAEALIQKQSHSVQSFNSGDLLTMGLSVITTTNAANGGTFTADKSYLVWGDNNLSASATTALSTGACPAPGIADARINRIWTVQTTNAVPAVQVKALSLPFNTNYTVYMLVSSDPTFATYDSAAPVTYTGGKFQTNYIFPANATRYITFVGSMATPANICTDGTKTINWWDEGWGWGTNSKTIIKGSQTFTFTLNAAANDILFGKPGNLGPASGDWYPAQLWNGIFFPRWTNQPNQPITFDMKMSKPAMGLSMEVCDVDSWFNHDVLTVNGKLGGVTVAPQLSTAKSIFAAWGVTFPTTNQAQGGPLWWDCLNPGRVFINFDRPIDEVVIDYTLANPYNLTWLYNDLQIKGIDVQCAAPPPPPTPDNVYVSKRAPGGSIFTDDAFTYKFDLENLTCNAQTIHFTDNLPSGLTWVGDSLGTALTVTNTNNYSATQNFTTDIVVPPGKSYLSLDATSPTAATYNNQAVFTVSGNTYLSDDPNQAGAQDATPLTVSAPPVAYANVTMVKSVSKTTVAQNEVFTYTFQFTNNEATAVKVDFTDAIFPSATFVTNTLTNPNGGTVLGDYSANNRLQIMGMTLPVGNSTVRIQANSNNTPIANTLLNKADITPDASPMQFMPKAIQSNQTSVLVAAAVPDLTTTIGQPSPAFVAGVASNVPMTVTNIGTGPTTGTITATMTLPANTSAPASFTSGVWSCNTAGQTVTCTQPGPINTGASSTIQVPVTPSAAAVGTQPGPFNGTVSTLGETNTGNNAASPMTPTTPVTGVPDLTTTIGQPSPSFVAGVASNVPMTVTNIGSGPTTGTVTASMTLPANTSAPASFTSGPWNCTTSGQTVTCTQPGPIVAGGSSTIQVPVTPSAATVGTQPVFNGTVSTPGETNTGNNAASPLTPSVAVAPAPAVTATVDKKFSSDNGVTFSDNITVTQGTTLIERIYYNNTSNVAGTVAAIQATLPAGFTLVAGSTKNCLNPSAGETVCNTDAGQGGAINEGAVWSGQTLNIAPTAGLYGIATNAASGRLEVGKKRYLNLNECVYNAIGIDIFTTNGHFNNGQPENFAQTNVANTAQASANCGAGNGTYLFGGGSVVPLDLLGQRYVNFNECSYNQVGADFLVSSGHYDSVTSGIFAGTNTANTAQASAGCASGNGVYGLASATNTAFDLFDKRYFNLQECQFYWAASTDEITSNAYSSGAFLAGTNASATPDTSAICGPGDGSFVFIGSSVLALDTLDTARGTGYIEFRMVANTAGSYTQNASLSGSNFTTQNDSGNITVVGVPDLTTSIGQPSPSFVAGSPSNVPLTVNNIGTGPTTGTITATMTLPANTSAPASFTNNGWTCATSGQTVTCTSNTPIAAGGSSTIQVPVTPSAATVGTQPGPFTGGSSGGGETNTGNNPASPMTPTTPVAPAPVNAISLTSLKVFLGGAYDSSSGLLRDDLRSKNLLPTTSPYSSAPATANASVFAVTGNDAIVDWVLVELHDATTPATIIASQAAFVQRDGDVVALNGTSAVTVSVSAGNYYVAVKHRNHLGVMTASAINLGNSSPVIDFTNPATAVYGTNAQRLIGSFSVLWSGNANGDNSVIGVGPSNDLNTILLAVLGAPANTVHARNYILTGYNAADINLDGKVIAAGPNNDPNLLLYTVFTHPGNTNTVANYVVQGQTP